MSHSRRDARQAALSIIRTLRDAGFAALLAGGCVRDMLLGREAKDFDVVTDALPDQVQHAFPRARAVGKQFGVILVRRFKHDIEVATFRTDGGYSNGRRPDQVRFTNDIEDARRRDFTINGMFYDLFNDQVIDHVGGRADLEARIIRTIGDPHQRFAEDHLRMLRAVRFATKLDFQIDPQTLAAIRLNAPKLARISPERIWMELEGIITNPCRARGWELLTESTLHHHLLKNWDWPADECKMIGARLAALPPESVSPSLALAALLCAGSVRRAEMFGRSLRLSNDQIRRTCWLVTELPRVQAESSLELADIKVYAAHPGCEDLLALLKAELTGAHAAAAGHKDQTVYDRVAAHIRAVDPADASPPPLLSGDDLIAAGFTSGPRFGEVLNAVYRAQLNERITTHADALEMAHRLMENDKRSANEKQSG